MKKTIKLYNACRDNTQYAEDPEHEETLFTSLDAATGHLWGEFNRLQQEWEVDEEHRLTKEDFIADVTTWRGVDLTAIEPEIGEWKVWELLITVDVNLEYDPDDHSGYQTPEVGVTPVDVTSRSATHAVTGMETCGNCRKSVDPAAKVCPYCEAQFIR